MKTAFRDISLQISLDPVSAIPLFRQLYLALREAIITKRLQPGMRLPPTRALARHLNAARNTVINAYEQLAAEGYVEGRIGSGTRVADKLPIEAIESKPSRPNRAIEPATRSRAPSPPQTKIFAIDEPAYDAFPYETMRRLLANRMRKDFKTLLGGSDPAGLFQLRKAIARYISNERGIQCSAAEIVITAGGLHGLDLVARALRVEGERVCIEDPGDIAVRNNLIAANAALIPVPVDEEGCDVAQLIKRGRGARLVCITPANQYPLGGTMPLARRLKLLEWAGETGALIFEDDADSEFRYATRPLAPLKALDRSDVVIYAATYSRILHPNLRLGYLILPPRLVDAVVSVRRRSDRHPPPLEQVMLAEFIERGHFAIHIRRMRKLYRDRQRLLMGALRRRLPESIDARPAGPGINMLIHLPPGSNDTLIAEAIAKERIEAHALSLNYAERPRRPGLLIGNSLAHIGNIETQTARLCATIIRHLPRPP